MSFWCNLAVTNLMEVFIQFVFLDLHQSKKDSVDMVWKFGLRPTDHD